VLLAAAGLAACTSTASNAGRTSSVGGAAASSAGLQAQYERVVRTVLPSVVQISTPNSTGSGVVYDNKGDIVTNAHVVGTAKDLKIRPATGSKVLTGKVIGEFVPDDLAVVRASGDTGSLPPAKFADSEKAEIGQIVLAMGNPLGLTDSVTQGIVSATGRTVSSSSEAGDGPALITSAIQTSAAINPGNSGGALVNLDSQVIGIPTLAAREPNSGGTAPGIGFAIPSNTVINIANQLIAHGKVTKSDRASLGITAETLASSGGQPAGVGVVAVTPGGPADKAGITKGMIIVGLNGQSTPSLAALEGDLAGLSPGDKVTVQLKDPSGATRNVTAILGSLGS
jgi:S1-C subfamily serine protease